MKSTPKSQKIFSYFLLFFKKCVFHLHFLHWDLNCFFFALRRFAVTGLLQWPPKSFSRNLKLFSSISLGGSQSIAHIFFSQNPQSQRLWMDFGSFFWWKSQKIFRKFYILFEKIIHVGVWADTFQSRKVSLTEACRTLVNLKLAETWWTNEKACFLWFHSQRVH